MKLTVYDKSNSHPALTYKGKRIITVCRDGSMYLSRILSRELSLHAGNRLCIARDEDRPKDWYMFASDDENGFTIWNDSRCARFSNSFIAGMILDAAKVEKSAPVRDKPDIRKKKQGISEGRKKIRPPGVPFFMRPQADHNGFRLIRLL